MTVGEMLSRMSAAELTEWTAYYNIEPFGDERADLRAGIVAATFANVNRDPTRQPKAFQPVDFMPVARAEKKRGEKRLGMDSKHIRMKMFETFSDRMKRKDDGRED